MQRCLEIAQKGAGNVSPNPMVGSIIVYKDKIIGEGYHEKYGDSHAEINAITAIMLNPNLIIPSPVQTLQSYYLYLENGSLRHHRHCWPQKTLNPTDAITPTTDSFNSNV